MKIDNAIKEIEKIMMYRGEGCQEGNLREILENFLKDTEGTEGNIIKEHYDNQRFNLPEQKPITITFHKQTFNLEPFNHFYSMMHIKNLYDIVDNDIFFNTIKEYNNTLKIESVIAILLSINTCFYYFYKYNVLFYETPSHSMYKQYGTAMPYNIITTFFKFGIINVADAIEKRYTYI